MNTDTDSDMRTKTCIRASLPCILLLAGITSACCAPTPDGDSKESNDLRRETQILTIYAMNPLLQDCMITATVVGSNASLAGNVGSIVERDLAEEIAMSVDGITHIDNLIGLTDALPSRLSNGNARFRQKIDDATITASIRSKLLWRAATNGLDIGIVSTEGTVRIDGTVYDPEQRDLVVHVAADTAGVRAIDDEIVVFNRPPITDVAQSARTSVSAQSNLPVSDTWIAARIKSAFSLSPSVSHYDIDASVRDGGVSLSGRAGTREARASAIEIAGHTRGVRGVDAHRLFGE
jgi:osmotically-inducible protein OsmY